MTRIFFSYLNSKYRGLTLTLSAVSMLALLVLSVFTCGCMNTADNGNSASTPIAENITKLYSSDAAVQKEGMTGLIREGNDAIVPLTKVFSSGDKSASYYAALTLYYLSSLSDEPMTTLNPVTDLFGSSDKTQRDWAINTICLLDSAAVPTLIDLAKNGNAQVQESAEIALIKIGANALPLLQLELNFGKSAYTTKIQGIISSIYATESYQMGHLDNQTAASVASATSAGASENISLGLSA